MTNSGAHHQHTHPASADKGKGGRLQTVLFLKREEPWEVLTSTSHLVLLQTGVFRLGVCDNEANGGPGNQRPSLTPGHQGASKDGRVEQQMAMAEEKIPYLVSHIRRLDRHRKGCPGMPGSTAEPTRDVVGIVSKTLKVGAHLTSPVMCLPSPSWISYTLNGC